MHLIQFQVSDENRQHLDLVIKFFLPLVFPVYYRHRTFSYLTTNDKSYMLFAPLVNYEEKDECFLFS